MSLSRNHVLLNLKNLASSDFQNAVTKRAFTSKHAPGPPRPGRPLRLWRRRRCSASPCPLDRACLSASARSLDASCAFEDVSLVALLGAKFTNQSVWHFLATSAFKHWLAEVLIPRLEVGTVWLQKLLWAAAAFCLLLGAMAIAGTRARF
jgi:hypothetical protein